jgi:hypothetical protein
MARPQTITLQPPIGGLVRRLAYQSQSPYTTPSCDNVWPDDALASRERIGSRAGLANFSATDIGGKVNLVADVGYVTGGAIATKIVVACDGTLYYHNAGSWTSTGYTTLTLDVPLTAAELFGKLYIANSNGGAIVQYTASTNAAANIVASAGTAPTNCKIVVAWRSRLVAMGDTSAPHLIYMSKVDDPTNWDYAGTTATSAWYGSGSDQGQLMEPITAGISHNSECLIIGCRSSLWVMRGDPRYGGRMVRLSGDIGIVDRRAWCYDTDGMLWFLSHDGLYRMEAGCGSQPTCVSREFLPEELLKTDASLYTVSMAYDLRFRGIILTVALNSGGGGTSWFIDTKTTQGAVSFWPMTFNSTRQAFYAYSLRGYATSSADVSEVLIGCRDGVVRRFDRTSSTDAGTNFDSYIDYGPFPLGPPGEMGLLQAMQVSCGTNSADVVSAVRAGNSPQEAFDAGAFATHTHITAGLNSWVYPRARGKAAVIRFSNATNSRWAMENVEIARVAAGKSRII